MRAVFSPLPPAAGAAGGYHVCGKANTMPSVIDYAWRPLATLFRGGGAPPKGLAAVTGFQVERYLGTWYEIARLDHRFERGLTRVTAEYSAIGDGSILVVNRGYDARKDRWREARGIARFMGPPDVASLKVAFFGPFGGAYHVIALDRENYRHAMVTSSSRAYLWILARRPRLDASIRDQLLAQAAGWGFRTQALVFAQPE